MAPWSNERRLGGLRRFSAAITLLTVLGHTWLGFEASYAQPVIAVATTYGVEALLEWIDARANRRPLAFANRNWLDFFLPAHITGLAVAMLLYPAARLAPTVFACVVAMASKSLWRMSVGGRARHVLNPSNFGITAALLAFPSVGIAPPYQFTAGLDRLGDWALPCVIILSGSFLNARYTSRLPLIATWLVGFVAQAWLRHALLGSSFLAGLMPMTGLAFLLFTFYMLTDPPTTPASVRGQIAFGLTMAAAYGVLMVSHVVFGLFFGLTITCLLRAGWIAASAKRKAEPLRLDYELPRAASAAARTERKPDHAPV